MTSSMPENNSVASADGLLRSMPLSVKNDRKCSWAPSICDGVVLWLSLLSFCWSMMFCASGDSVILTALFWAMLCD